MSVFSEILAAEISSCFHKAKSPRILVTELTASSSRLLHAKLLELKVNSYLVVESGSAEISEEKRIISYKSLVSIRNDEIGWVFLVPSYLKVTLPDSISNSAKTNIFAGDWPWVDNDPVVSFFGEESILTTLLQKLGIEEPGTVELCCELVRKFLRASEPALQNARRQLLFDDILSGVDKFVRIDDDSFLEQLMPLVGLPYSEQIRTIESLAGHLERCKRLGRNVLSQPIGSTEFRDDLLKRASSISPNGGSKLIRSVEAFLDGLLECGDYFADSAFVLRPALKNVRELSSSTEASQFTYNFIKELFQVLDQSSIKFKARFEPQGEQISSSEGKKLISNVNQLSRVVVSEISSDNREGLILAVYNRTQKLAEIPLSDGVDVFNLEFSNEEIEKYKNTLTLKVKLENSQEKLFEEALKLVLIGEQRPAIILIGTDLSEYNFGDDIEREVELPTSISVYGNGEFYIQDDEEELTVRKVGPLLTRSADDIDPLHYYSGRAVLSVGDENSSADIEETSVTLVSNISANSQETLDQEYEWLAKEGPEKKLKKLHEIFQGSEECQPINLAEVKESVQWKANLARQFETNDEFACFPILLNLSSLVWDTEPVYDEEAAKCYTQDPSYPLCKFNQISEESNRLFSEYSEARSQIIKKIKDDTKYVSYRESHPICSSHPTYIEKCSGDIEGLIDSYVNTYCDILSQAKNLDASNSYASHERYFLLNLDTVFFTNDAEKGLPAGIRLLGPWHPITLINRYLLQKSFYDFVNQHWFTGREKQLAKKLSGLLGSLRSDGWISRFIATETTGHEPKSKLIYQQDSGWIVSANESLLKVLSDLSEQKRGDVLQEFYRVTGMSLSDESDGLENSISDTLFEYTGVFSFDRRLEIDFASDYSMPQICNSTNKFTDKFLSQHGFNYSDQLVGGVHITSRASFAQLGESEIELIRTLEDKIYLYGYKEQSGGSEYDIYFSGSPKSYIDEKPIELNCIRGSGASALVSARECYLERTTKYIGRSSLNDNYDCSEKRLSISITRLNEQISSFGPDRNYFSVSEFETEGLISNDAKWTYFPARGVDPALIIKALSSTENLRALWEYKIDLFDRGDSYYLLSVFEDSVLRAIDEHLPDCAGGADQVVATMNRLGLALNKEAHQTIKKAKGCVGLTGAARIMNLELLDGRVESKSVVSYLVPVDSFDSFFGKFSISEGASNKLTDLLLLRFHLPAGDSEKLGISVVGVEAKFKSDLVNEQFRTGALEQAFASVKKMRDVIQLASEDHSLPLRILLVRLAQFCMRIRSGSSSVTEESNTSERLILKKLVSGQFSYLESGKSGVVIISHADTSAVTDIDSVGKGVVIRLDTNKESNDWPCATAGQDGEKVTDVRTKLFSYISGASPRINIPPPQQEESEQTTKENSVITTEDGTESDKNEVPDKQDPHHREDEHHRDDDRKSTENFQITFGESDAGLPIHYSPNIDNKRISNFNMMITGSSGNGKTQFIKSLLAQYSSYEISALVIDFKNDYAPDTEFQERSSMDVQWVAHDGLPYNPFVPLPIPHPGTKKMQFDVSAHIIGLASALRHAYGLGVQQEAHLKDAMRAAYRNFGISEGRINIEDVQSFPDFNQIAEELDDISQSTRNRLDPLFALDIFRDEHRNVSFSEVLSSRIILDLSQIQSEDVQNALACMTIYSSHKYFNSQTQTGKLKRIFVFDEAHRVLKSPDIERLSRECRAYGVGVVLSSQKPSDFPSNVLSNLSTRIIHGNGRTSEDVEAIKKILGSNLSTNEIGNLGLFDAYVDNAQHSSVKIKTLAYPHLIITDAIKSSPAGLSLDEVKSISGLKPELAVELLDQLSVRGLIYLDSGRYKS